MLLSCFHQSAVDVPFILGVTFHKEAQLAAERQHLSSGLDLG